MIKNQSPSVLILDLEVGNENALDYLSFIHTQYPSLPILIASSHNDGEEIALCYEARDSLNNVISHLRKYLGEDPNISLIRVKGIGYTLAINV